MSSLPFSSPVLSSFPCALVGVSCRFPGSSNTFPEFTANLLQGFDGVRRIPPTRWNADYFTASPDSLSSSGVPPGGRISSARCGWIDGVNQFDSSTFNLHPRESEHMDPQQKVLLQCAAAALEDSGLAYRGSRTGVFVGIGQAEQLELTAFNRESINSYSVTGSALSIAANRVSFTFDLRGPSMSVDTACSSSATALHLAVQSIAAGDCDQALVCGVNILMNPSVMIQFSQLGVLSPNGRCASFDASADGYVRSEGAACVLIKPLKAAERDGDYIYCVVRGTATNQDGHQSPSLTLPSSSAQRELFRSVCRNAQVNPRDIFYVEAHATGTKAGDPTEANAIGEALEGDHRGSDSPFPILRLGSVKSNIGHLETASFMAGLLKCIAQLETQRLIPNLHYKQANPQIDFDRYHLQVQQKIEQFPDQLKQQPERAIMMISSFGFGGSNAAAIIQGYKNTVSKVSLSSDSAASFPQLFLLSAGSQEDLKIRIDEMKFNEMLRNYPPDSLAYTLFHRPMQRFMSYAVGPALSSSLAFSAPRRSALPPDGSAFEIVWVFAGQGPQHPNMGRELYSVSPVFRSSIDASDAIYREAAGVSFVEKTGLFAPPKPGSDPNSVYNIVNTLPALVFLQIALVDLLVHLGVPCRCVFGHSFGELAAGYAAKITDRRQCVLTAYERARILKDIDQSGSMMAVGCSAASIQPLLDQFPQLWIAAFNGPQSITVAGIHSSISSLASELKSRNIFHRVLKISNAYHTPLMAPVRDAAVSAFRSTLHGAGLPAVDYFSTVTGNWKTENFNEQYAWDGIIGAVRFDSAVSGSLARYGAERTIYLELTAHPVLASYLTENGSLAHYSTLHREKRDVDAFFALIAALRSHGIPVQMEKFNLGASDHQSAVRRLPSIALYRPDRFSSPCHAEDLTHAANRLIPHWKPLAGRPVPQPIKTWEVKLQQRLFPWIVDHCVQGPPVFPAAAFIEALLEFTGSASLNGIRIQKPLLPPAGSHEWRLVRITEANGIIRIHSKSHESDPDQWVLHVEADSSTADRQNSKSLAFNSAAVNAVQESILTASSLPSWAVGINDRCTSDMNKAEIYSRFSSIGLEYGPAFQCIQSLKSGDHEALALLEISHLFPSTDSLARERFHVHPAILDCAFQVLLGAVKQLNSPFVPTSIERIEWFRLTKDLPSQLHVAATLPVSTGSEADNDGKRLSGHIAVFDPFSQQLIGLIRGFEATQLQSGGGADSAIFHKIYQSLESHSPAEVQIPISKFSSLAFDWAVHLPTEALALEAALDSLCLEYVSSFLSSTQFPPSLIASWSAPRQRYWNWLQSTVSTRPAVAHSQDLASLEAHFPHECDIIHRIGRNFPSFFTDSSAVQSTFFAESSTLMQDLYAQSRTFSPFVELFAQLFVDRLKSLATDSDRVFNILEVGAGTGGLTSRIFAKLAAQTDLLQRRRVVYYFTDVSSKFLSDARAKFSDYAYGGLQFEWFNVEDPNDANSYRFAPQSFDFILAFDVLHAVKRISIPISSVRSLLRPGGCLMAIEVTRPWLWMELFFGLFDGWWLIEDTECRSKCFIDQSQWKSQLEHAGFQAVQFLSDANRPDPRCTKEFNHSILVAYSPNLAQSAALDPSSSLSQAIKVFDATTVDESSYLSVLQSLRVACQSYIADESVKEIAVISSLPDRSIAAPIGSSFIGFGRVLANEYPQLRVILLTLESSEVNRQSHWLSIVRHWIDQCRGECDREFIVQGGTLNVPRFIERAVEIDQRSKAVSHADDTPFRLEISHPGSLDSLRYHSVELDFSTPLASTEVEIEVKAAALNFKDLMLALGMLKNPLDLPAEELQYSVACQSIGLGLEFSGIIRSVGSNVERFKAGDLVYGIGSACFGNRIRVNQQFVVLKPNHLSHVEAATIPIVYATAYAALIEKARLRAGETVLIHSAAGGIGQAAIQLARHIGAEVIGTVGSTDKRAFLESRYGVKRLADSHDTARWFQDIQSMTGGFGVDCVLNSLKDDAIPAGLKLLSLGGRFCEIGKIDLLGHSKLDLHSLLRNIEYYSVQLDLMIHHKPGLITHYLDRVNELVESKSIGPLVDRVYPWWQYSDAFQYLKSGKHMGKIVLDFAEKSSAVPIGPALSLFARNECFVLSGGTGGLGWELMKAIASWGGRDFLLLSRSGDRALDAEQRALLSRLERYGVRVFVGACDILDRSSIDHSFAAARSRFSLTFASGPASFFHLAMVLDDQSIASMTEKALDRVVACKVQGGVNVWESIPVSQRRRLYLFSSAASALGNPNQANYSAANTFLDRWAESLSQAGVDACSMNLGFVENAGILAADWKLKQILSSKGFGGGLKVESILEFIRQRISSTAGSRSAQSLIGSFDFVQLTQHYPILKNPFFSPSCFQRHSDSLASSMVADQDGDGSSSAAIRAYLISFFPSSNFSPAESLASQGLDSLTAVELSSGLKRKFGFVVSQMTLLGGISVDKLIAQFEKEKKA